MILDTVLKATPRDERGKNASRRLRAGGRLPVAVYGVGKEAIPVSIDAREFGAILRSDSGRNAIFTLDIEGHDSSPVKIQELDVHPVTYRLQHVDMLRISMTETTRVSVAVEFTGESHGVREGGGMLEVQLHTIEVECLPRDIPQSLEVDITNLEIGDNLTVGQIPMPDGVTLVTDSEQVVAGVHAPRVEVEPVEEGELAEPALVGSEEAKASEETEASEE